MSKIIFICNTPFQCIISTILKLRLFTNSEASIIISNQMTNSNKLYKNIKSNDIFESVYLAENSECFTKNKDYKYYFKRAKCDFFGCSIIDELFDDEDLFYDSVFLYNPSCYSEALLSKLRKINPHISVNLFDEGYSTYTNLYKDSLFKHTRLENMSRTLNKMIFRKKYIIDVAKTIYLMDPDLVCWDMPFEIRTIPKVDLQRDFDLVKALNDLFGYTNEAREYENKYVFFEESFFWDTGRNFDIGLINKISKIIHSDDLIIKLHPRNKVNRFINTNLKTSSNNGLPWEIVAMNMKDDNRISFLTITSGSALSYKILFNINFNTYLLYKCVSDKEFIMDETLNEWLHKFLRKYPENMYVLNNIDEFEVDKKYD